MELIADHNKLKTDPVAQVLINKLSDLDLKDTFVYYNFPFYRGETREDLVQAHVLFLSKKYGVIFFRCFSKSSELTDSELNKLDDLDSHIFSRINKIDDLRLKRRELKINVTPLVFINDDALEQKDEIINLSGVQKSINDNKKVNLSDEEYDMLLSAVEGTVHLRKKKDRVLDDVKQTKGKILDTIQNLHATFDIEQKRAALNVIDSPQRIRGLAGSGKTIILTMKVALYHLQNPEANILYTYFTKALYGQIRYLIEKYYRDFSENREPDWTKINILHGWGGKGLRGVYSDTCNENLIETIPFRVAKVNNSKNPFDYVCEKLINNNLNKKFDLTLIDEGQDFPINFYRLCRKITKKNRIVWAYDDFQNIFDITIQNEKETFGTNEKGEYYVDFSRDENVLQDIVLHKCYRNPRIALLNAFSLGLGIYNDKVLQRLEDNNHWTDLGFKVEKGNSTPKEEMIISRPKENSPVVTNDLFNEDSVQINLFDNLMEEADFVCAQIVNDIEKENLRADDICVIGLDAKNIEVYFNEIEKRLIRKGINVFNILNASNNNTSFNIDNHVTLSTLNKAKGNEAGMVYIVGIDSVFQNKDFVIARNKLFTAITRTKGWVTMTGFKTANQCEAEMQKLRENNYKLIFEQPTKQSTRTILRGMTKRQENINKLNDVIAKLNLNGMSTDDIFKIIEENKKSS